MYRYALMIEFEAEEHLGRQRPEVNIALCEGVKRAFGLKDAVFTHMSMVRKPATERRWPSWAERSAE